MLNTLRNVEVYENHVRWIYLTTVLCMGGKSVSMREYIIPVRERVRGSVDS